MRKPYNRQTYNLWMHARSVAWACYWHNAARGKVFPPWPAKKMPELIRTRTHMAQSCARTRQGIIRSDVHWGEAQGNREVAKMYAKIGDYGNV